MCKRMLLLSLIILATGISAKKPPFLTLKKIDGTLISTPLDGLKLAFAHNQLHVLRGQDRQVYAFADLAKGFFTESNLTAIELPAFANHEVNVFDRQLQIKAAQGTAVQVYGIDGRRYADFRLSTSDTFLLPHFLAPGIYIVVINGQAHKVQVR